MIRWEIDCRGWAGVGRYLYGRTRRITVAGEYPSESFSAIDTGSIGSFFAAKTRAG